MKNLFFVKNDFKKSYSQSGEDLICNLWLSGNMGYYVDVGANHPITNNNTYLFYQRGWRGINVEPDIDCYKLLLKKRSKDINLHMGVGKTVTTKMLYTFDPNVYNTFSKRHAKVYQSLGYKLVKKHAIELRPLSYIFERYHVPSRFDLLSVDTEGYEMKTLSSIEWHKHRPKFIILETIKHKTLDKKIKEFSNYLYASNYLLFADTFINSIYISGEYKSIVTKR